MYVFSPSSTNLKYRMIEMKKKKGGHVCCAILLAFAQTIPPFPNFVHDFRQFSTNSTHVSVFLDFFFGGEGKMESMFTFFCVKSIHLGGTFPYISYLWKVPPPLGPSWRGIQFWFHQLVECNVMRISQPNFEKSVGKGILFERVI